MNYVAWFDFIKLTKNIQIFLNLFDMELGRLLDPIPLFDVNHGRRNILMPHHLLDIDNWSTTIQSQVGGRMPEGMQGDLRGLGLSFVLIPALSIYFFTICSSARVVRDFGRSDLVGRTNLAKSGSSGFENPLVVK